MPSSQDSSQTNNSHVVFDHQHHEQQHPETPDHHIHAKHQIINSSVDTIRNPQITRPKPDEYSDLDDATLYQPHHPSHIKQSAHCQGSKYRYSATGLLSHIPLKELLEYTCYPQRVAALKLGVSISTLKRSFQKRFQKMGKAFRWPYHARDQHKKFAEASLHFTKMAAKNREVKNRRQTKSSNMKKKDRSFRTTKPMALKFLMMDNQLDEKYLDGETTVHLKQCFASCQNFDETFHRHH